MKILEQRKILVTDGQDQLRWGQNKEGIFNIHEAKRITLNLDPCVSAKSWQKLWSHQGWMKIKLFMWLVHHKKILTWENIQKRGVMGPSRCPLCEAQEETMEHILNNYTYINWLWDYFSIIFQQTDRDKGSIINTMNKWRKFFSENEILNLAWTFTPSFTMWNVWKERNKTFFKDEETTTLCLMELILK